MQKPIRAAVEAIPDDAWTVLADYPKTGVAEIAETTFKDRRLVVRRVRLLGKQDEMFPQWRHFPFFTNRTDPIDVVEREHRQHAVVELSIRDLKDQGLAHFRRASSTPTVRGRYSPPWHTTYCGGPRRSGCRAPRSGPPARSATDSSRCPAG